MKFFLALFLLFLVPFAVLATSAQSTEPDKVGEITICLKDLGEASPEALKIYFNLFWEMSRPIDNSHLQAHFPEVTQTDIERVDQDMGELCMRSFLIREFLFSISLGDDAKISSSEMHQLDVLVSDFETRFNRFEQWWIKMIKERGGVSSGWHKGIFIDTRYIIIRDVYFNLNRDRYLPESVEEVFGNPEETIKKFFKEKFDIGLISVELAK